MTNETERPFQVRRKITDIKSGEKTASNNFPSEKVISMTFNMPEEWHIRFKLEATKRGIYMKDLLEECFELYLRERG